MARKPRIHYSGAFYHVILRGNCGQNIFYSKNDRYRARIERGTFFCTVVTHKRPKILAVEGNIEILRNGFQYVMQNHPFRMDAHIILPDHLHCIWTLPDGDCDFSTRWRLIKSYFTRHFQDATPGHSPRQKKFWKHLIRDERDMKNHVEYIHYNPVKHG